MVGISSKTKEMTQIPQAKLPLSVFVICCDEEPNIERCLNSVSFAQEIIVVDSGSRDGTVDICRRFTDKIIHRDWEGFLSQKIFAFQQCSHEWVFNIDADEEVSPGLKARIEKIVRGAEKVPEDLAGFEISRVVFYMDRWWRKGGWFPEYRLRLVRKSKTSWGGIDPHEHAIPHGSTQRIEEPLHHFTYTDLYEQIRSLNALSSAAADSHFKRGKTTTFLFVFLRPLARFTKFYFFKKGFLEGKPGLVVAVIEAIYAFLKYAKLWELQRNAAKR